MTVKLVRPPDSSSSPPFQWPCPARKAVGDPNFTRWLLCKIFRWAGGIEGERREGNHSAVIFSLSLVVHPPFPVNIPSRASEQASRIWEFQVHAQRSRGTIERWGSIGLLQTLHYAIVYRESLPFTLNQRHVVKYFLVEMPEYHGKEEGKEGVWCPATDARGLKCLGVQNMCDKLMSILSLTC